MEVEELDKRIAKAQQTIENVEAEIKEAEAQKAKAIAAKQVPASQPVVGNRASSDEQKCMRMFGAKNWRDLIEKNVCAPEFARVPMEYKHMAIQLKQDIDISRMMQQIFHGEKKDKDIYNAKDPYAGLARVKGMLDGNWYGRDVLAPRLKAFESTTPGSGAELVPTAISAQFIEEFELSREVASLFPQINMPSDPFKMPVQESVTTARIQAQNSAISGTNFGTSEIELDATKLVEFMPLPEELNEDSAPQILAFTRNEVAEAQVRAWETAIINGDDSVTHQDDDVTAAEDARNAWKGLRFLALANSANGSTVDFGAAAATTTNMRALRAALGKYGVNPQMLAWLVSPKVWYQLVDLDEVTTVDKFGNLSTIKTGTLAALDGIPIIQSEFMRDDLDDTGVNSDTPANNIKSSVICVNHRRFLWGVRRPMRVRATFDPTPPNDQWLLASWWRGDFKGHTQDANEISVAIGLDVA